MTDEQLSYVSDEEIKEYNKYVKNLLPSSAKLVKEVKNHVNKLLKQHQLEL